MACCQDEVEVQIPTLIDLVVDSSRLTSDREKWLQRLTSELETVDQSAAMTEGFVRVVAED